MKAIKREEAVRLCLEGERISPAERKRLAAERLRELVSYAREHSAYYKKGVPGSGGKISGFRTFRR